MKHAHMNTNNSTSRLLLIAAVAIISAMLLPGRSADAQFHEADADALKAFEAIVQTYRDRPAFEVMSKIRLGLKQGDVIGQPSEVEASFLVDRDRRARVQIKGYTCIAHDGRIDVVHEATPDSYFTTPDDDSPYYTLMAMFLELPYPHLAIGLGEQSITDVCMQLHSKAPYVLPTSLRTEQDGDRTVQHIVLTSDYATLDFAINPDKQWIDSAHLEITGGLFVQQGATLVYEYEFTHVEHNGAPDDALFAFDPGDRQRVMMVTTLAPKPQPQAVPNMPGGGGAGGAVGRGALVGEEAPGFVLSTATGEAIDLEDLRGRVVVLDFWATWCDPCLKALPVLHEIADWAREEMMPVKVITINIFERPAEGADTPDKRLASARAFWDKHGFALPIAMDFTDETAQDYGVSGIPATFVIRADGVMHSQHSGFDEDYGKRLRKDIADAIAILEGDDDKH